MAQRSFFTFLVTYIFMVAGLTTIAFENHNQVAGDLPLRVTVTVLSQRYCTATRDTDVLQAQLLLTFTNVYDRAVILSKGSGQVIRTLMSASLEDAAAGKRELDAKVTPVTSDSSVQRAYPKTPDQAFSVLPPGGTFQTKTSIAFEVSRTDDAPSYAMRPGPHVLQIVVRTWQDPEDSARELAARWAESGRFWYETITSEAAVLNVDRKRLVEDCSKYAGLVAASLRDPNAVDAKTGITALMAAVELNDLELFNSLLTRGANVNAAAGGVSALCLAAGTDTVYVKRLLEHGAEVNVRSLSGQTPLTVAVRAGKIENVRLLITAGADVNMPGPEGKTPLKLACELLESRMFDRQVAAQMVNLLKLAGARQ